MLHLPSLLSLLFSWLPLQPQPSPVRLQVRPLGKKKKKQFHSLKHSIGTHILDAGEDIYFAKDWLGHKNIQNTTIYSKFSTGTRDARARGMFSSNRVV